MEPCAGQSTPLGTRIAVEAALDCLLQSVGFFGVIRFYHFFGEFSKFIGAEWTCFCGVPSKLQDLMLFSCRELFDLLNNLGCGHSF